MAKKLIRFLLVSFLLSTACFSQGIFITELPEAQLEDISTPDLLLLVDLDEADPNDQAKKMTLENFQLFLAETFSGGGLDKWVTATEYEIDDVVWLEDDNKIYRATVAHTSGISFNPANWQELSEQPDVSDFVEGPASSVARQVPVFSDTTGKKIEDSELVLPLVVDTVALATSTTDGSDDYAMTLTPAGGLGSSRGSWFALYGNEHSTKPGDIAFSLGGASGADFDLSNGNASIFNINSLGKFIIGDAGNTQTHEVNGAGTEFIDASGLSTTISGNTISVESGGGDASMILQHQPGGSINRFDGTTYSKLGANPDYQELMKHPSFELDHEGVCSNCDAILVSSITPTPEDKNRLQLTFSEAGTYTVDIDTGARFGGLPATASCYINTTNTDVQMAQRTNGVNGAIENVVSGGSEVLVKPSAQGLAGTTSTGFQIIVGSAGTVYLNNCSINTEDNVYQVGIASDPVDCGLAPSDFTNFGTVAIVSQRCHREGAFLVMDVKFTAGTPDSAEARVNIKYKGDSLTSKSATSIRKVGSYGHGGAAMEFHGGFVFAEPSTSYLTFSAAGTFGVSSVDSLAKANANTVALSGFQVDLNAKIPIANWSAGQDALSSTNNNTTITKVLSADVSTNGTTLSDLTFSDLVIGCRYKVILNARLILNSASDHTTAIDVTHDGGVIASAEVSGGSQTTVKYSTVREFTASATTLTFVTRGMTSGTVAGDGTQSETFAQLRRIDGQFNATLRDVVKSEGIGAFGKLCKFRFSNLTTCEEVKGECIESCSNTTTGEGVVTFKTGFWSDDEYGCAPLGVGSRTLITMGSKTQNTMTINSRSMDVGFAFNNASSDFVCFGN